MRDAFGGAFSIKLMLVFLMLYVAFICVALNYARAFRVKNRIINIIEQKEGYCGNNRKQINNEIDEYLDSAGYVILGSNIGDKIGSGYTCLNGFDKTNNNQGRGYCIYNKKNNQGETCEDKSVYSVETYMVFKLPIININFPIVIKGETRPVEKLNT